MKHKQEVKRNWTHKNQNTKRVVSGDILSFIEDASHSFIKQYYVTALYCNFITRLSGLHNSHSKYAELMKVRIAHMCTVKSQYEYTNKGLDSNIAKKKKKKKKKRLISFSHSRPRVSWHCIQGYIEKKQNSSSPPGSACNVCAYTFTLMHLNIFK